MTPRSRIIEALSKDMDDLGRAATARPANIMPKGVPTHAQLGVLFMLSYHGEQSIKQLATRFRITSSAATQLVNGLVKDGLLVRHEDSRDRRRICVGITAKGKKKMEVAKHMRLVIMTKAFTTLTTTELLQIKKIVEKIVAHLKVEWTKNHKNNSI